MIREFEIGDVVEVKMEEQHNIFAYNSEVPTEHLKKVEDGMVGTVVDYVSGTCYKRINTWFMTVDFGGYVASIEQSDLIIH